MTRVTLVALAFSLSACAASPPPPAPAKSTAIAPATLDKVCHAEHVDATSQLFVAVDGSGNPVRIEATPTTRIADMGNQIFDLDGTYLGAGTGSEFPWGDAAAKKTEDARVAALMNGSAVPRGQTPQRCP